MALSGSTMSPKGSVSMVGRMIVARFPDGRMIKGTTQDFVPNKATFHVYEGGDESCAAVEVPVEDLKAIFFVKSFEGDKDHRRDYDFEKNKGYGRKCRVTFPDGEVIAGYTSGYSPTRPGFFIIPADESGNNSRVFVVNRAVSSIEWT